MKLASMCVRYFRPISVLCLTSTMLITAGAGTAMAQRPLPARAMFRGGTIAQWSVLQNEWALAAGLGGDPSWPDTVRGMRLLPPRTGTGPGDYVFDVVIPAGTGLVHSPFFIYGEVYEDGTYDDPDDPFLSSFLDLIFNERVIEVRLDGKVVLSGTPAELGGYTYGPTPLASAIPYAEPQDRGGISAVAAIWTTGVGSVYGPLPPGKHTLEEVTDGPIFGHASYLYNITVLPRRAARR